METDLMAPVSQGSEGLNVGHLVEAMGLEPTNLLTASQALYQLSYAPSGGRAT
jgi:hypothetical protein